MNTSAPRQSSPPAPALTNVLRVYLRQSINEDRNAHGVEAQRSICERFALERNLPWLKRREYVDVGYSRDDGQRPEYLRLLAETSAGDVVLLWDRSRLGVDLDYAVAARDLVQRRGAKVIVTSTGETIDFVGEHAAVIETLHGASGGGELRRIRRLTREKLRERVLKGYVASKLPYGLESYPEDPADLESWKLGRKVPAEETVILRVVAMYLDGCGWRKMAESLNCDGVPAPINHARTLTYKRGKRAGQTVTTRGKWSRSHLADMLTNPAHRGTYVFGARGGKGGKFPPITIEHPEWRVGDAEMWAQVDAAMASRTTDMRSKLNSSVHALSGVCRCQCGGGLMVLSDGRKERRVRSYTCSWRHHRKTCWVDRYRVRKERIEAAVAAGLEAWFDVVRTSIHAAAAAAVESRISAQAPPDVTALERELSAARTQQSRLVKLAMATGGEVDAVAEELRVGQVNIKRLEAELVRAAAPRTDACQVAAAIEAEALQRLDALRVALGGPNAREALRTLFPRGLRLLVDDETFTVVAEGVLPTGGNSNKIRIPDATSLDGNRKPLKILARRSARRLL